MAADQVAGERYAREREREFCFQCALCPARTLLIVAVVSALAGVIVAFGLTQLAGWVSGRVRSERALWRLETELATVRTALTVAEAKLAQANFRLFTAPKETQGDGAHEVHERPGEAEYLSAAQLVAALPTVEYFLKDSDSIAVGLRPNELETAKNAITYYNLMRPAYSQNMPDYLLMGIVEETARAAPEMVRLGARLKPRKYAAAKARRETLDKQAQSAREPEDILLRSVMAQLYPGQEQPERYPQEGKWGVAVYRHQDREWSLLLSRLYIPMTLRVFDGPDEDSYLTGVYFLMRLLAELTVSGAPPAFW